MGLSKQQSIGKVAFIQAAWHQDIVGRAADGFCSEFHRLGEPPDRIERIEVPGAYEIPLRAQQCCLSGDYAAIVAAGFVVDGGIYRHEFVAQAVINGLMRVQLDTSVPIFSVVLTPKDYHESGPQHQFFAEHFETKGSEAARAAFQLLNSTPVETNSR